MITVYRVVPDVNNFQYVLADDVNKVMKHEFDGTPVAQVWQPPTAYSPNPIAPAGDFWGCFSRAAVFAATPKATQQIDVILMQSCERLPLCCEDGELVLCNVIKIVNCLNKKLSRHEPEMPQWIEEYVFHPKRFSASLFKIPETRRSEVLCVEGIADPWDEFKGRIETLGLKGLLFEKVWNE